MHVGKADDNPFKEDKVLVHHSMDNWNDVTLFSHQGEMKHAPTPARPILPVPWKGWALRDILSRKVVINGIIMGTSSSKALVELLRSAELDLLRSKHIRLRVDKVCADGGNVLCVAGQVRARLLRQDLRTDEIVEACHASLSVLHRVGLSPLISSLPRAALLGLRPPVAADPFRIRTALDAVGLAELLSTPLPIRSLSSGWPGLGRS